MPSRQCGRSTHYLPKPKDTRRVDPALIQQLGTNSPHWQNGGDFFNMKLVTVQFPLAINYETGNDCGIQLNWSPGSA